MLLGPRSFRARAISSFSWDQVRPTLIMDCCTFLPRSLLNSFFLLQAHVNLKCPCAAAHCIEASRTLMFPSRAPRQGHFSNPSQMLTTARMLAKAKAFSYIVSRLAILSPRLSRNPTGANSRPTFVHLGDFTNLTRPNVHRCLCHLVI